MHVQLVPGAAPTCDTPTYGLVLLRGPERVFLRGWPSPASDMAAGGSRLLRGGLAGHGCCCRCCACRLRVQAVVGQLLQSQVLSVSAEPCSTP